MAQRIHEASLLLRCYTRKPDSSQQNLADLKFIAFRLMLSIQMIFQTFHNLGQILVRSKQSLETCALW